jgi:pimeloyl-ACP methyl ester carboxylesterase
VAGSTAAVLEQVRSFAHPQLRVRETFLTPTIGGAPTVAVLSEPLDQTGVTTAWVLCHSYGVEQIYGRGIEVELARALARLGFAVLRFDCQGYGDSGALDERPSLATHLRDTVEAAALVRGLGYESLAFGGPLFGGAVAALAADAVGAAALALWEPVVDGRSFLRARERALAIASLSHGAAAADEPPLGTEAVEAVERLDLRRDLAAFAGESLLVQVSRGESLQPAVAELQARLHELGGRSAAAVVHPFPGENPLGAPRHVALDLSTLDRQAHLAADLVAVTGAWAGERLRP